MRNSIYAKASLSIFLFLVGLAIRLNLSRDFDGLYGQDSFAYYNYAVDVQNSIKALKIPGEMYWPMGFPIVLAMGFALFGQSAEVAQMVVVVFGALTGSITFLLVYDALTLIYAAKIDEGGLRARQLVLENEDHYAAPLKPAPTSKSPIETIVSAALITAILVTFSGQVLQSSVVIMADVPALFWATLSAWCLVRYGLAHKGIWLIFASVTLAIAGITRWNYLLLAIPFGVFFLTSPPSPLSVNREGFRVGFKHTLLAIFCGLLILLPQIAHSRQNPAALEGHSWLRSWSLSHALEKDFVNPDGTFHYEKTIAHFYMRAAWDGYYLHPIFLPFMGVGVLTLILQFRKTAPLLILFGGWFLMEYGFLIGIPYQNIRFSMAFFTPLAVMAGSGITLVFRPMLRLMLHWPLGQRYRIAWGLISVLLIMAIPVYAANTTYTNGKIEIDRMIGLKNADLNTVEWTRTIVSEGDVYTLELWLMMLHYAPELHAKQIYYETPDTLQANMNEERPTYLLLNLWAIENQWVGKAPYIAYHWLVEHFNLKRIGRYGYYTLLRVEGQLINESG